MRIDAMKYGVPIYEYRAQALRDVNEYNIGDYIQSYAIYEFYRYIGISDDEIEYISIEDLSTYDGKYMIVFLNMYGGILNASFSSRIIPVFWGFNYAGYIDSNLESILRRYQPIGCRDMTTLQNMRSRGIESFLSGCISLTLQTRSRKTTGENYFFVDTPSELDDYIPSEISKKMQKFSHLFSANLPFSRQTALKKYDQAINLLARYSEEATVVVTGRLHCASPCIAMGIPVIITKVNRDLNMGWIERVSPIYTAEMFDSIDWHPESKMVSDIKKKMRKSAELMIQSAKKQLPHYELSYDLEESVGDNFNSILINKLDDIIKRIGRKDFKYAIWGLGDGGGIAYRLIKDTAPNAKCIVCIDAFKEGDFFGMKIEKPEKIEVCFRELDYVFVTTYAGRKQAVEYLNSIGMHRDRDFSFLISRVNGKDEFFTG